MGYVGSRLLERIVVPDGPFAAPPEPELPEARGEIDAILGMDLAYYLPECLLTKVDRATMAASLEGRAPFLDHRLVEFGCRLPAHFKLKGLVTKRVLRRAMTEIVPPAVRRRIKRGLTVPLASWIAGPLRSFVEDAIDRLDPHVFQRSAVRELLEDHVARRRDNRRELWTLVMLQCWYEAWCARSADAPRVVPAPTESREDAAHSVSALR
jgi:asparagine synthase (glutamine-hydrolysing)